jgi:hypothetical protein
MMSNSHSARRLPSCSAVGLEEGSIAMKKFCQDWFEFWTHPGRHRRGPRDTDRLKKVSYVCGRPWDIYTSLGQVHKINNAQTTFLSPTSKQMRII